jgi:D-alanyl-D-alanine carboxypeptidase/D-alanyl-D-alanine-endopeptidase (penicillin-binding protein 4)
LALGRLAAHFIGTGLKSLLARSLVLLLCALPAWAQGAGLPAAVSRTLAAQQVPASALSVVILDPATGKVVLSELPDTPRSPASTIKTVTTFAALDMLGPTFTWHTHALIRGTLTGGVLDGDLVLQGGGDPYITLERWWSFAQSLREKGLRAIHGDIIIDNTAFSLPPEDPGAFDGKPNRSYNVVPDALMVNFQSIEFRLAANADTREVEITANPAPFNLVIDNHVRYAPGRCTGATGSVEFKVASEAWDRVEFSGALSPNCAERSISRVLLKPATYAFGTFVQLWRQSGGEFSGKLRV